MTYDFTKLQGLLESKIADRIREKDKYIKPEVLEWSVNKVIESIANRLIEMAGED